MNHQRPLYMSAQALAQWKVTRPKIEKYFKSPDEFQKADYLQSLTETSQKFFLPEDGLYFEDTDPDSYVGDFHLPFRHVALEFSCTGASNWGRAVNKMIVVAGEMVVDSRDGDKLNALGPIDPNEEYDDSGEKVASIFVWMHGAHGTTHDWVPIPMMAVLPYSPLGALRGQVQYDPHFHIWGPGWAEAIFRMGGSKDPEITKKMMAGCLNDGIIILLQMCSVLNCSNVRHELVKEPKFINMKRMQKGEPRLDSYRILMVTDEEKVRYDHEDRGEPGWTGQHRRQHVRRGHIRRYQTGRAIWINQMIVGKHNPVKAHKDYKVRHRA